MTRNLLDAYLALERAMITLDKDEASLADEVRDVMDPIWRRLSAEERDLLSARMRPLNAEKNWVEGEDGMMWGVWMRDEDPTDPPIGIFESKADAEAFANDWPLLGDESICVIRRCDVRFSVEIVE